MLERVEYEVDDADGAFIESLRKRHSLSASAIDEEKFEIILDRLEKKAFQRSNKRAMERSVDAPQSNDDVPCAVCNDRDYESKNLIVFCDGCSKYSIFDILRVITHWPQTSRFTRIATV